jgi:dihydropyrimidinase
MAVTWERAVFDEMESVIKDRINVQTLHGLRSALMVNDDELYASFSQLSELSGIAMVHAKQRRRC